MKNELPRLAILGAGPIGLEAAALASALNFNFTVYERGRIGEHLQRWGHIPLFSPFGMNAGAAGKKLLQIAKTGHVLPEEARIQTGRELVSQYLQPLGETLQQHLQLETAVLSVGRKGFLKDEAVGDPSRGKSPFRLLLRDKKGERVEEADVVLDCTGTFAQHRWLGEGGIPALGEVAAENKIGYWLDDILGEKKNHYANKTVLVLGGGFSAATTVHQLTQLGQEATSTWAIWLVKSPHSQPMKRLANDPLKERDRVAARANALATRPEGNLEFHGGATVESIEAFDGDKGFKVGARITGKLRFFEVERIIANVGYSPDRNLYRELQVHECYASFGPMKLAAALSTTAGDDCMKQVCHGPETLKTPEPNFFILGAKSYGRNAQFLLRIGYRQVRDAFGLIVGPQKVSSLLGE